jgi:hypothetical protein
MWRLYQISDTGIDNDEEFLVSYNKLKSIFDDEYNYFLGEMPCSLSKIKFIDQCNLTEFNWYKNRNVLFKMPP